MDEREMMTYGKGNVFAYRTFMEPVVASRQIPESSFKERDNTVFGIDVTVEVGGKEFLSSFTEGDNSKVVATDSMKNFIQRHLATFPGTTAEQFVHYVAHAFLEHYAHIETVKMTADLLPFEATVTTENDEPKISDLVYKKSRNEKLKASIHMERREGAIASVQQMSELTDLQLIKVKDNSFVGFIRDEYTTLPEDGNRPLFIYLNIGWTYEPGGEEEDGFVAHEQVKDIASTVFHETASPSIQSLIYHIGLRMLQRFPSLKDVRFESQNRTWDTVVEQVPDSEGKVYTEPRLPYGFQRFQVTRADLENERQSANIGVEESHR
ncbi:urate oxidase/2-oxo-4-hydroxy-4-carboxy-5-ureidoimidazoline decarboxylase [Geomicrobium sediminis]|uniref:Uricase n=1 Tax=Geomicrobium sediminis TaxID=1347788 RepID=A0ABS2P8H6_9BACL|nr:urate oxidase/2-oxo-4-hydroxy-4-carboxy-5-ureidoimidazoline decarboxylase [Geomicrobium sediminis]